MRRLRGAERLVLLLDYDGTLTGFTPDPDAARPDDDLISLLKDLADRPATSVHVISGRRKETLGAWLGALPLGLHAEHGLWSRWSPEESWEEVPGVDRSWKESVRTRMQAFVERVAGSFIEEKGAAVVWHFRQSDVAVGEAAAVALERELRASLRDRPVEVLPGSRIVEARAFGVHKGRIVEEVLRRERHRAGPVDPVVAALGDDRTDEDMFAALPENGMGIKVGSGPSRALTRLRDQAEVRPFLRALLGDPS